MGFSRRNMEKAQAMIWMAGERGHGVVCAALWNPVGPIWLAAKNNFGKQKQQ
jgi:hypothetical protein